MARVTDQPLQVIARSPFKLYYEGRATALSAVNAVGSFDILPGHADFFSVLEPCRVIIDILDELPPPDPAEEAAKKDGKQPEADGKDDKGGKPVKSGDGPEPLAFTILNGIVTVRDDKVMLFCNI